MMIVPIKRANYNLAPLLEAVKRGETVILTNWGVPVAVLSPVEAVATGTVTPEEEEEINGRPQ